MQFASQSDTQIPACSTAGGQQVLNSYRNAGAALLQAMQHQDSQLGHTAGKWSREAAAAGDVPDVAAALGDLSSNLILSTSPGGQSSCNGGGAAAGSDGQISDGQGCCGAAQLLHEAVNLQPGFDTYPDAAETGYLQAARSQEEASFHHVGGATAPSLIRRSTSSSLKEDPAVSALPDSMVRNTFIDFKPERSPSMERFFEERKCRSSPVSRSLSRSGSSTSLRHVSMDLDDPFAIATPTDSVFPTPRSKHMTEKALSHAMDMQAVQSDPLASLAPPVLRLSQFISDPDVVDRSAATVAAAAARLAQELRNNFRPLPQGCSSEDLGSAICSTTASSTTGSALLVGCGSTGGSTVAPFPAQVPSRGSALHSLGACKPCAFVFQNACANGVECEFCHLCDPGERKRRKKDRRKVAAGWTHRFGDHEC